LPLDTQKSLKKQQYFLFSPYHAEKKYLMQYFKFICKNLPEDIIATLTKNWGIDHT
jgi:hypothetical protein